MEPTVSKDDQVLEHVMTEYRNKRSNGPNVEKPLKNESEITEKQWFDMITMLDLRKRYPNYINLFVRIIIATFILLHF